MTQDKKYWGKTLEEYMQMPIVKEGKSDRKKRERKETIDGMKRLGFTEKEILKIRTDLKLKK